MATSHEARVPIRFGVFEVHVQRHTLRKNGQRVRIQELPFRLLGMLLERPGDIVTREELQQALWPGDQYGEFDIGLNTAVTKLRHALGDSAHSPRFIETIPRVGYRFIGQLDGAARDMSEAEPVAKGATGRYDRAAITVLGVSLLAISIVHFTEIRADLHQHLTRRFSFTALEVREAVMSLDGKNVAYVSETERGRSVWLHSLVTDSTVELPGTEGAEGIFWAPDGLSLGFAVSHPEYQLKTISIDGLDISAICALPGDPTGGLFAGGSWSTNGESIVFSWGGRLYQVPALGGRPDLLVDNVGPARGPAMYPHFLPRGEQSEALLYASRVGAPYRWTILTLDVESRQQKVVAEGSRPVYSPAGFLVYGGPTASSQGVWAIAFSPETLETSGEEFLLRSSGDLPSFSNEGTVAFRDWTGPEMGMKTLVWRNRRGEILEKVGRPQPGLREFSLSPDRRFAAVTVDEPSAVWMQGITRSSLRKLTSNEANAYLPTWSPTGAEIAYTQSGDDDVLYQVLRRSADGDDEPSILAGTENAARYAIWSRDGKYLVYQQQTTDDNSDIRYLELNEDGSWTSPKTFVGSPADETAPALSPDGNFMAYVSNETGRRQVWVRPFPNGGRPRQVSTNGGAQPRWRDDGAELFYVEDSQTLMAVSFASEGGVALGAPQYLFESTDLNFRRQPWPLYELSGDGQRILTAMPAYGDKLATIRIVENWYEEYVKRR